MSWTDPRDWELGDNITRQRLNNISSDLTYLNQRPADYVHEVNSANYVITSTVPVALSTTVFRASITTNGGDVFLGFGLYITHSVSGGTARFDVLMDGSTYISSGTGVYTVTGAYQSQRNGTYYGHIFAVIPWVGLSAGTHYFDLMAWTTSGTLTVYGAAAPNWFWAKES